ncbi:hypothetical protein RRG08_030919 [Elysia crispata]|uniref:Uncharacterized protein n=1 Tax=Elysia crispata TaxID=231223 RepID=A0AAE1AAR9_9GAST|nr:hypothetical protein RRG08_030919 [Elysia crispata]
MAESGSRRLVGDKTSDWLARRKSSAGHAQLASWRAKELKLLCTRSLTLPCSVEAVVYKTLTLPCSVEAVVYKILDSTAPDIHIHTIPDSTSVPNPSRRVSDPLMCVLFVGPAYRVSYSIVMPSSVSVAYSNDALRALAFPVSVSLVPSVST